MKRMNWKSAMAGLFSAAMLSAPAAASAAQGLTSGGMLVMKPISADVTGLRQAQHYDAVSGVIKSVYKQGDNYLVRIENAEGMEADLSIGAHAYVMEGVKLQKGEAVTGFFRAGRPMILIYPARYTVEVVAAQPAEGTVFADLFDDSLTSSDGMLQIHPSEETTIVRQDGTAYAGSLINRRLVVHYGPSTRSIPAKTTPYKITVLDDVLGFDAQEASVWVNGDEVAGEAPYLNEEGVLMVPLVTTARALGHEVVALRQSGKAVINRCMTLTAGEDAYRLVKDVVRHLGAAPAVKENVLFVPLSFFSRLLAVPGVDVMDGRIRLDTFDDDSLKGGASISISVSGSSRD